MIALTLPDWINPENARHIALVVGVVAVVVAVLVLRFVQKLMLKAVFTVVLVLLAFGAWYSRADLSDCAETCNCRLLWQDIEIPASKNPRC